MCRQKGGRKLLARRIHQICSEKAQRRWSFQAAPLSWLYLSVLWVIIPCVLSWGNPRHHFWNEEASRSARCQGERGKSRPFRLEVGHAVSLWCCNCFSILDKRSGTGVLEEENLQNALPIAEDVLKMWRQVVVHCKGNGTKNRQRRWQQGFSKDRSVHSREKNDRKVSFDPKYLFFRVCANALWALIGSGWYFIINLTNNPLNVRSIYIKTLQGVHRWSQALEGGSWAAVWVDDHGAVTKPSVKK